MPTTHSYTSRLVPRRILAGQADAVAAIEHCIQDNRQWLSQDKLLMNDAETERLLLGARQQHAKVSIEYNYWKLCHCSTISR